MLKNSICCTRAAAQNEFPLFFVEPISSRRKFIVGTPLFSVFPFVAETAAYAASDGGLAAAKAQFQAAVKYVEALDETYEKAAEGGGDGVRVSCR